MSNMDRSFIVIFFVGCVLALLGLVAFGGLMQ
jgi:hypothetical protein